MRKLIDLIKNAYNPYYSNGLCIYNTYSLLGNHEIVFLILTKIILAGIAILFIIMTFKKKLS